MKNILYLKNVTFLYCTLCDVDWPRNQIKFRVPQPVDAPVRKDEWGNRAMIDFFDKWYILIYIDIIDKGVGYEINSKSISKRSITSSSVTKSVPV